MTSKCLPLSTVQPPLPPQCPFRTWGKMQFFSLKRGRASALISGTFRFIVLHLCSESTHWGTLTHSVMLTLSFQKGVNHGSGTWSQRKPGHLGYSWGTQSREHILGVSEHPIIENLATGMDVGSGTEIPALFWSHLPWQRLKTRRHGSHECCSCIASGLKQPTGWLHATGSTGRKHGHSGTPRVILYVKFLPSRLDEAIEAIHKTQDAIMTIKTL